MATAKHLDKLQRLAAVVLTLLLGLCIYASYYWGLLFDS